jgi:hypothetical protein
LPPICSNLNKNSNLLAHPTPLNNQIEMADDGARGVNCAHFNTKLNDMYNTMLGMNRRKTLYSDAYYSWLQNMVLKDVGTVAATS